MKRNTFIKLKAAFLLAVFALNTVVGFACAVGVDMGFNSKHHDEEATEAVVHIHKDGKRHVHHEKKESPNHNKSHHPDEVNSNHKAGDDRDNCCNDKVRKFEQTDKTVANAYAVTNPVFFTAFIASFYDLDCLLSPQRSISIKYFVRSHHPPISDIRIAIQSFQI